DRFALMLHAVSGFQGSAQLARDELVHVTPHPRFPRLDRAHKRVARRLKMPGRVLVFRRVATTDVAAFEAQAQVYPGVAQSYAFGAHVCTRLRYLDAVEMGAGRDHR